MEKINLQQCLAETHTGNGWPDLGSPRQRQDKLLFLVDVNGKTRFKSELESEARDFFRAMQAMHRNPVFRHYVLTEEERQKAEAADREKRWLEMIYKPTPARTIRRKK